jgi:hypothetical protein
MKPAGVHLSCAQMTPSVTRFALRAIDIGASAIFMALCTKAFCIHFYGDVVRAMRNAETAPSGASHHHFRSAHLGSKYHRFRPTFTFLTPAIAKDVIKQFPVRAPQQRLKLPPSALRRRTRARLAVAGGAFRSTRQGVVDRS